MIQKIDKNKEIPQMVAVIQNAFKTAAIEFNLTPHNCPSHPSFITEEKLISIIESGVSFFGLYNKDFLIGLVALEQGEENVYYLEKLCVLPEFRNCGYGTILVNHIFDTVRNLKGSKVSIAIIDKDEDLKMWYKSKGFIEMNIKNFDTLPFSVCFLEKLLQ